MSTVVAIDGPAGAGKSTVAKLLADRFDFTYVNTGSLYRAVALSAYRRGVDLKDVNGAFAKSCNISIHGDTIYIDDEPINPADLRTAECSAGASVVSSYPEVREALLQLQRQMAEQGWIVMEGRDIGTVIFPEAAIKFFLTASVEERARRRFAQNGEVASNATLESVIKEISERDYRDSHREVAPLSVAKDAIYVDTTGLSQNEVVDKLSDWVRKCRKELQI